MKVYFDLLYEGEFSTVLASKTSYDEFQVQLVQVKEGRIACGFLRTVVTSHSSHRVNTNATWGVVGSPSS
jgi:hypothetical protein